MDIGFRIANLMMKSFDSGILSAVSLADWISDFRFNDRGFGFWIGRSEGVHCGFWISNCGFRWWELKLGIRKSGPLSFDGNKLCRDKNAEVGKDHAIGKKRRVWAMFHTSAAWPTRTLDIVRGNCHCSKSL